MKRLLMSARMKLGLALAAASLASLGLYGAGALSNGNGAFAYLPWNLMLSWIPLAIAIWLEHTLRRNLWSSWRALAVTAIWLAFLPNTFYMISDFVHIQEAGRVDLLYDVVMFTAFIFNGVVLGCLSLFLVHRQLIKRVAHQTAGALVGLILLLCSFAIYIGRELRWNTWDILANPASLLVDISDRILNPGDHPQVFTTTLSFFVLLTTVYGVFWYAARAARQQRSQKSNLI